MKKSNAVNYVLIFSVGFLLTIGLIVIASVSADSAIKIFGTPYYYLTRHLVYVIIGVFLGFLASKVSLDLIKKYSLFLLSLNILLFAAVSQFGFSAGGATRWLVMGPVMIQPAEFIKLTFIIYLCLWLSKIPEGKTRRTKKHPENLTKGFLACFSFFVISAIFLYHQPDISSLVILFLVSIIIYFLAKTPLWHTILLFLIGSGGLITLIKLAPYRLNRIQVFLNPETDPMGMGYQIKQALIAIGSGGIFGLGLGMSRQKLGFLPEPMTDAIFAVFSEEAGFVGAALVIILFIIFLYSGITIAKRTSDRFSFLLASGITIWIIIQAFVNMGAMTRIFPLTGVALPFLSYGGSHLIAELVAVGLLVNISRKKHKYENTIYRRRNRGTHIPDYRHR